MSSTPFVLPQYPLESLAPLAGDPAAYRTQCVKLAQLAEKCEKWNDMAMFMREVLLIVQRDGSDLTVDERNLLYTAYKALFYSLRESWKTTAKLHHATVQQHVMQQQQAAANPNFPVENKHPELLEDYKVHIEKSIMHTVNEITSLLENSVIKTSQNPEAKVFYSKLCADYYRYCSEIIYDKSMRIMYEKKCFEHYSYSLKVSHASLPANHPYRLGVSLNYSVCLFELLKDKKQACDLARNAFDCAIHKLDELDEKSYKDATLIMQLLRDNVTLWSQIPDDPQAAK